MIRDHSDYLKQPDCGHCGRSWEGCFCGICEGCGNPSAECECGEEGEA
jgi:hypothetical protein